MSGTGFVDRSMDVMLASAPSLSHSPFLSPKVRFAEQVIPLDDGVPRQFLSGGPYGQEVVRGQSALLGW
jgi:hypothetical protein